MRKGKRRQVYLEDAHIELARKIGKGNVSRGIREALKITDVLKGDGVRKATKAEATGLDDFGRHSHS